MIIPFKNNLLLWISSHGVLIFILHNWPDIGGLLYSKYTASREVTNCLRLNKVCNMNTWTAAECFSYIFFTSLLILLVVRNANKQANTLLYIHHTLIWGKQCAIECLLTTNKKYRFPGNTNTIVAIHNTRIKSKAKRP